MDTSAILRAVEHRAIPLPSGPWVMTQAWHELLFAHWPIKTELLRPLIPSLLEIDIFDNTAWIGIVPFRMSHVHPRGLPSVPGLSAFPELNVRTYVISHGMPGVYFFSLDAANPLAVALARSIYHLPYFNARMSCQREEGGDTIFYTSHRVHRGVAHADFEAHYRPTASVVYAPPDSIEHWFTERYLLYTVFHDHVFCGNIHHRQWPLQIAEVELLRNTMAQSHNLQLTDTSPLLHYVHLQEVLIWPLRRVV
jgi:uncharacterized protein